MGKKYPATVRMWRNAWERFIPFLEFVSESAKSSMVRMKLSRLCLR